MKTIFTSFLAFILTTFCVFGQQETQSEKVQTLFSDGARLTGWFVDLSSSYSQIDGRNVHMPGFGGGITMNRNFKIGIFGKSLTCHETYLKFDQVLDEPVYLVGGYGGLLLEPAPMVQKVIHLSFPCRLGAGGAGYLSQERYPEFTDEFEFDHSRISLSSSPFWVLEPGANLELNITGFMQVYAGYSYRWMLGMNLENTAHNAFNGSSFNIGVKFGKLN